VDNSCGFTRVVVGWILRSRGWRVDSLAARHRADCAGHQSCDWPKGDISPLGAQVQTDSHSSHQSGVRLRTHDLMNRTGKELLRFQKGPGADASALSTASSASSDGEGALLFVDFLIEQE
jgi:hypothetical protein